MSITNFIILVTILSIASSLITEAIKKVIVTDQPTLIVLLVSAITGWGGGTIAYILLGISFTAPTIACLILLAPVVWLIATLGYDKVLEVITQIGILV